MKKIWKKLMFVAVLTGTLLPVTAYADQGVMLKWHVANGEQTGKLKQFNAGETIRFEDVGDQYEVKIDGDFYYLPKNVVLKTVSDKETSYIVNESGADLYQDPSHSSYVIQKLNANEILHVSDDENANDGWLKVKTSSGQTGYVQKNLVMAKYESIPFANKAYIKNDVRIDGSVFNHGEEVAITDFKDGKFAVSKNGKTVWVRKAYISFEKPKPKIVKERKNKDAEKRETNYAVLDHAYKLIGKPYRYGANGPYAYDCSSFTQTVFRKVGIHLPRTSQEQARVGMRISKNTLQPGDLLFFNTDGTGVSHVGIYVGNGRMIHAGGDRVHVTSIEKEYWQKRYLFAKRV